MKVRVNDIKVEERIRKDFGDIEELAADIKENGLINPLLLTPDLHLIAGERRLRALKHLGVEETEANVMTVSDAFHKLRLEISENENRKGFTFSEKMSWAMRLKEETRKSNTVSSTDNETKGGSRPKKIKGRVSEVVSRQVGLGCYKNLQKGEYIMKHADEEMIKKLDANQLSINKAYTQLKAANERLAKEHADLSDRFEKQVLRADELETKMEVMKSADDADLIRKIDELKVRERKQYERSQELTKKLAAAERMRKKNDDYLQEVEAQLEEEKRKSAELAKVANETARASKTGNSIGSLIDLVSKFYGELDVYVGTNNAYINATKGELMAAHRCLTNTVKLLSGIDSEVSAEVESRQGVA